LAVFVGHLEIVDVQQFARPGGLGKMPQQGLFLSQGHVLAVLLLEFSPLPSPNPRSPPTPQMANGWPCGGARHAMWSRAISVRQMSTRRPSRKSPSGQISAN
jgi:hypothetical protein